MWSKWQGGRLGAQYSRQQSETASAPFIDHARHRRLWTLESPQNDAEKLRETGGEVMTWLRLILLSKEGTTLVVKGCWQCVLLDSKLPSTWSRLFSPLRTRLPSSTFSLLLLSFRLMSLLRECISCDGEFSYMWKMIIARVYCIYTIHSKV